MAKKKAVRQKKLRLVDNSPVGLTESQCQAFRVLYRVCAQQKSPPLDSQDIKRMIRVHLGRFLYIYVEALCHDAGLEIAKSPARRTVRLRRDAVDAMSKLCGHALSVNDIIRALSRYAPVPEFAASAIRRDFLRIFV